KQGQKLEADTVIQHCIQNLAKFKVPQTVEFIEALPRNATGKVLKRTLRDQYVGKDTPAVT
ncbi:MAG: acyl-CoA synthetase, partial [Gammaproteobacteria bacterium]|nr:acyl-CoA synthetase [Gammaproteobacteria bacterium]